MARVKSKKNDGVYLNHLQDGDVSYWITYKGADKKKKWFKVGKKSDGVNENYAKAKRSEFVNIERLGEEPDAVKKRKQKEITTLNDLADIYFDDKDIENRTNKKQQQKYNMYIKDDLGTKDILLLIRDDISKLQKDLLKQKKSPSTVNGIITLVKAVINHSIKEKGLVYINPFNGFKKLSVDDTRERFLSRDEVHQLLDKTKSNIMIHQFVKLALSTGARLQGVLHIKKKDISLANSSISINDFKGESTYMGFFDDELKEELKVGLVGLKANDYYIGGASTVVSSRIIQTSLKPILDKLFNVDLEADDSKNRVVIHTLRHTFASQLAKKGVPIFNIQKLMNHSEIEMTMRYAKLAPDHGIDVIKGLYN